MKGCASQAATAICLSMEQPPSSSPSSSAILLASDGGRFIDRHNPIIRDEKRISKSLPPCNTSQPPLSPKPRKLLPKKKNKNTPCDENQNQPNGDKNETKLNDGSRKSWSCTRPGDFLSPPSSSRYLLREKAAHNALLDSDSTNLSAHDTSTEEPSLSDSPHQVVVLRVSLHCRGCERKLRKHLSRMEALTSFDIDFAAKKVTVTGNVTPLGVLSSISKVKNAQLWSPTISSSFTPSLSTSNS